MEIESSGELCHHLRYSRLQAGSRKAFGIIAGLTVGKHGLGTRHKRTMIAQNLVLLTYLEGITVGAPRKMSQGALANLALGSLAPISLVPNVCSLTAESEHRRLPLFPFVGA